MRLVIEIECENAAFSNDDGDGRAVGPECARILRRLAGLIECEDDPEDGWRQPIVDVNGNTVGHAEFQD